MLLSFEDNLSTTDHLFSTEEEQTDMSKLAGYYNTCDFTIWVIEARSFIKTGKQSKLRLIVIEKVVNRIDYENKAGVCLTLLGLNAFTGCDTTKAFYGRGMVKALRTRLEHDSVESFRLLGNEYP